MTQNRPHLMQQRKASHTATIRLVHQQTEPKHAYGSCSKCSCPGFQGSSTYTCQRGGCGHHYDDHW